MECPSSMWLISLSKLSYQKWRSINQSIWVDMSWWEVWFAKKPIIPRSIRNGIKGRKSPLSPMISACSMELNPIPTLLRITLHLWTRWGLNPMVKPVGLWKHPIFGWTSLQLLRV
jgi:hypothetical protein